MTEGELANLIERKKHEVDERVQMYRAGRGMPEIAGRTVILVDDGIATGGTVRAAVQSIRALSPSQIILAVPVASPQALARLSAEFDKTVCILLPFDLFAIGTWYDDFSQVSDEEVMDLLKFTKPE